MQVTPDDIDKETTVVQQKGQATIPKEIREALDIEKGDEITWIRKRRTVQVEVE
jgi:AbrB family looped-hinge helix DNA binding protein